MRSQRAIPGGATARSKALLAQCSVGAAALTVLAMEGPSVLFNLVGLSMSERELFDYFWTAALSVGVAALGSTAHAAYRANH
jgi:hypothetical protein